MKNAIPTGLAYPLIRGKEGSPKNIEENKKKYKMSITIYMTLGQVLLFCPTFG